MIKPYHISCYGGRVIGGGVARSAPPHLLSALLFLYIIKKINETIIVSETALSELQVSMDIPMS